MTGKIITARHGKPNLSRDLRITAREYGPWWGKYDEAGLLPDERPPQSLIDAAKTMTHVVCSTLPRAIETARMIVGEDRVVPQDAMFVEAPLPPPPIPLVKLRPGTWGGISRVFWVLGYAPNGMESHTQARVRVTHIADKLLELAQDGDVMLCAHGYLNWMIDRHVQKKRHWKLIDREGGNNHWSWRAYEVPQDESSASAGTAS